MTQVVGLSVAIEDKTQPGRAGITRSIDDILRRARALDTSADSATEALKQMADQGLKVVVPAGRSAADELNKVRDAQGRLRDSSDRFVAEGRKASNELDRMGDSAKEAATGLNRLEATNKRTGASFISLRTVAATALAGLSFGVLLRDAREYLNTAVQIENRLKLVTSNPNQLNNVQGRVFAVAQGTRNDLSSTAELYQRLADSTRELDVTQEDLFQVLTTVNQAVAAAGVGGETASAGLQQFAQALAANRFQGDELRSVFENLPPLADAIARGLGVTKTEVRELGAEGLLTTRKLVEALLTQGDAVEANFAKTSQTLDQSNAIVANSFVQLAGAVNEAFDVTKKYAGVTNTLASSLSTLADLFKNQTFVDNLTTTGNVTAGAVIGSRIGGVPGAAIGATTGLLGGNFNVLFPGGIPADKFAEFLLNPSAFFRQGAQHALDQVQPPAEPTRQTPTLASGLDPDNYLREFQDRVKATQARRTQALATLENSRPALGAFPRFEGEAVESEALRAVRDQLKQQDAAIEKGRTEELRQTQQQQNLLAEARTRAADAQLTTEIAQLEAHQASRAQIIARQNDLELVQLERRQAAELAQLRKAGGDTTAINELRQVHAAEAALTQARGATAIGTGIATDAERELAKASKQAADIERKLADARADTITKLGQAIDVFAGLNPEIDRFASGALELIEAASGGDAFGAATSSLKLFIGTVFDVESETGRFFHRIQDIARSAESASRALGALVRDIETLTELQLQDRRELANAFEFVTANQLRQGPENLDLLRQLAQGRGLDTESGQIVPVNEARDILRDLQREFPSIALDTVEGAQVALDVLRESVAQLARGIGEFDTSTFAGAVGEFNFQRRIAQPGTDPLKIFRESFGDILGEFNTSSLTYTLEEGVSLSSEQQRTLQELLAELRDFHGDSVAANRASNLYFDKEEIALRQRLAQAFTGDPANDRQTSREFDRQINALYQIRLAYERAGATVPGSGANGGAAKPVAGGTIEGGEGINTDEVGAAIRDAMADAVATIQNDRVELVPDDLFKTPTKEELAEYFQVEIPAPLIDGLRETIDNLKPQPPIVFDPGLLDGPSRIQLFQRFSEMVPGRLLGGLQDVVANLPTTAPVAFGVQLLGGPTRIQTFQRFAEFMPERLLGGLNDVVGNLAPSAPVAFGAQLLDGPNRIQLFQRFSEFMPTRLLGGLEDVVGNLAPSAPVAFGAQLLGGPTQIETFQRFAEFMPTRLLGGLEDVVGNLTPSAPVAFGAQLLGGPTRIQTFQRFAEFMPERLLGGLNDVVGNLAPNSAVLNIQTFGGPGTDSFRAHFEGTLIPRVRGGLYGALELLGPITLPTNLFERRTIGADELLGVDGFVSVPVQFPDAQAFPASRFATVTDELRVNVRYVPINQPPSSVTVPYTFVPANNTPVNNSPVNLENYNDRLQDNTPLGTRTGPNLTTSFTPANGF